MGHIEKLPAADLQAALKRETGKKQMESVTIKDIAKRCNVAVSTVSRAINNHPDINPETRKKIMKVIEENNYIPNNSAQNLKKTVSRSIGVIIKGADNQLFAKMRPVLVEGIGRYDYDSYMEYVSISGDEIARKRNDFSPLDLRFQIKSCPLVDRGNDLRCPIDSES